MRKTVRKFGWGDLNSAARGMTWKPYDVFSQHAATAIEHQGRVIDATTGIIRITFADEQPGENGFLKLPTKPDRQIIVFAKAFLVWNQLLDRAW